MSNFGYEVAPISWNKIDVLADNLREKLKLSGEPYFPILDVLEQIMSNQLRQFHIEITSKKEMPEAHATVTVDGKLLKIREDTYHNAYHKNAFARFTLAHELGHLILHCNKQQVFSLSSAEAIPAFRHSERQADYFAASILMPRKFFSQRDSFEAVKIRHGVSSPAARIRLQYLSSKGQLDWA